VRYKFHDQFGFPVELNVDDSTSQLKGINISGAGWAKADEATSELLISLVGSIVIAERASFPADAPVWAKRAQGEGKFAKVALDGFRGLQNKLKEAAELIEVAAKDIEQLEIDNNDLRGNMQRLVELSTKSDVSFGRVMDLEKKILERMATEQTAAQPDKVLLDWLSEMMQFEPSKELVQ
jgi:hypothetical protein